MKSSEKFKYVIVTPRQIGGGPIALHALCMYLEELKYDAKIFYINDFVYRKGHHGRYWLKWCVFFVQDLWNEILVKLFGKDYARQNLQGKGYIDVPIKQYHRKWLPHVDRRTIVIYPETVYGNILGARNVVRWLLYHNTRYAQSDTSTWGPQFGRNDLFFAFRDVFNDEKLNPEERKLYITYFDLDTYKRTNFGNRVGKCFFIRKGKKRDDLPKTFDGPILDDLPEEEIVRQLNEKEYCILYDTQTFYSQIAALCGCIAVIVPEKEKGREDYRKKDDPGYGEAFGFVDEEIYYAKNTASKVEELYIKNNMDAKIAAERFIEQCNSYFNNNHN